MWGCDEPLPGAHEMLVKLRSLGECETTNLTPQNDLIYLSNDPKTAILVRNNPRSRHRVVCSFRGPKWISYLGLFSNLFSNRISVRTFDDFVPKWGNILYYPEQGHSARRQLHLKCPISCHTAPHLLAAVVIFLETL